MTGRPTYTSYMLICLFALAIIVLGAQELHRYHVGHRGARTNNTELLGDLHGALSLDTAHLSGQDIQRLKWQPGGRSKTAAAGIWHWLFGGGN